MKVSDFKQGAQSTRKRSEGVLASKCPNQVVVPTPSQTQGHLTSELQGPLETSNRPSVRKELEVGCLIYISAQIHINSQIPLSN